MPIRSWRGVSDVPNGVRCECLLHLGSEPDGLHRAEEFDQESVAGRLEVSAMVLDGLWLDDIPTQTLDPGERAFLVLAHEAGIADHVGGQNGCKAALHGWVAGVAHVPGAADGASWLQPSL